MGKLKFVRGLGGVIVVLYVCRKQRRIKGSILCTLYGLIGEGAMRIFPSQSPE